MSPRELLQRAKPCRGCPFVGKSAAELADACEGGDAASAEMLCHESGCLDGEGPDYECRGFSEGVGRG